MKNGPGNNSGLRVYGRAKKEKECKEGILTNKGVKESVGGVRESHNRMDN